MPAEAFMPIFVEVHEHIDTPIQLGLAVLIEIGVHLEQSTGFDLVVSATLEVGIRQQLFLDPGELLQEVQKRFGIEKMHEYPGLFAETPFTPRRQLDLVGVVEFNLIPVREIGKFADNLIQEIGIEKIAKRDVRKRFRILILLFVLFSHLHEIKVPNVEVVHRLIIVSITALSSF
ncbi:MAG: hypothetical protein ABFS02_06410 [Pseudomonadota bacterium]